MDCHDAAYTMAAPFTDTPKGLAKTAQRMYNVSDLTTDLFLITEGSRAKHTQKMSKLSNGKMETLFLPFQFNENYFHYHTIPIPTDIEFQHLHYGDYLKGEIPVRTSIFSKNQSRSQINTIDPYTSLCHRFIIGQKEICIYGTIIGSYGIKYQNEIARSELDNFNRIFKAFYKDENRQLSTIQSRDEIINFTNELNISRSAEKMEDTIDHIFISEKLYEQAHVCRPLNFFIQ